MKAEKEKFRAMIREKKKDSWQNFCEENGVKNPWEIVKWAKDPWHLKGVMGKLVVEEERECRSDGEKVAGLLADHFKWREERIQDTGKMANDAPRPPEDQWQEGMGPEELEEEVRRALRGTCNTSG